jgi:hypothetical protein
MTALPSVIPLAPTPDDFDLSYSRPAKFQCNWIVAQDTDELQIVCSGVRFCVHALGDLDARAICAVLPLDALFDVRLKSARRLWLATHGGKPGKDAAALSKTQRDHFVKALRALDGHLEHASYREIASILFGENRIPSRGWKSHDLRDRTIRLVRLGNDLMQGGYRQLLLYPFRQRLR